MRRAAKCVKVAAVKCAGQTNTHTDKHTRTHTYVYTR